MQREPVIHDKNKRLKRSFVMCAGKGSVFCMLLFDCCKMRLFLYHFSLRTSDQTMRFESVALCSGKLHSIKEMAASLNVTGLTSMKNQVCVYWCKMKQILWSLTCRPETHEWSYLLTCLRPMRLKCNVKVIYYKYVDMLIKCQTFLHSLILSSCNASP